MSIEKKKEKIINLHKTGRILTRTLLEDLISDIREQTIDECIKIANRVKMGDQFTRVTLIGNMKELKTPTQNT